jgi:hypothetical protein
VTATTGPDGASSAPTPSAGRRALLQAALAGGALAGVAAVSRSTSAAAAPEASPGDTVAGRVVSSSTGALDLRSGPDVVRVTAARQARIYAGGSGLVPDLAAFEPGDRVVAQGRWSAGGLVATSVGSMLQPVELTAQRVDRSGTVAETGLGRVRIGGRLPDAPADADRPQLQAGDRVSGMLWRNPRTGEQLLLTGAEPAKA